MFFFYFKDLNGTLLILLSPSCALRGILESCGKSHEVVCSDFGYALIQLAQCCIISIN